MVTNVARLGYVKSIAVQPDGKIMVGSSGFNMIRIARLNADGSWDNTFDSGPGPSGGVDAVALQADGEILICGTFTAVNGVVRPYVARLHGADVAPGLSIAQSNTSAIISWPLSSTGFVLDQSPTVTGVLSQVAFPYTTNGNIISVSAPATTGNKFYRLRKLKFAAPLALHVGGTSS